MCDDLGCVCVCVLLMDCVQGVVRFQTWTECDGLCDELAGADPARMAWKVKRSTGWQVCH